MKQSARPCHGCGYDLRGHAENGNCPECGRPVRLSTRRRIASLDVETLRWLHATLQLVFTGGGLAWVALLFLGCACFINDGDLPFEMVPLGAATLFASQAVMAIVATFRLDRARIAPRSAEHAPGVAASGSAACVGSLAFAIYFAYFPDTPPAGGPVFGVLATLVAFRHLAVRGMAKALEAATRHLSARWSITWLHMRFWSELGILAFVVTASRDWPSVPNAASAPLAAGAAVFLCGCIGIYCGATIAVYANGADTLREVRHALRIRR